ncbi:MAG TPA: GspE/PulE family protein [Methylomirabilota bacterium]|nr:GspE/PulE family protein [Methylomirabilota bacterium]
MMDTDKALYAALKEFQVVDTKQLDDAFTASQNQKIPLGGLLLDRNLIAEEDLGKLLADIYKFPFIHLGSVAIPKEVLTIVPEIIAKQQNIIAFKKDKQGLHVAMENPSNTQIIQFLQNKIGMPIVTYLATKKEIIQTQNLYLKDIGYALEDVIKESLQKAGTGTNIEPPIIKLVETIIGYAYQNNASDIHLEPEEGRALVRFRIDGVLHDITQFALEVYPQIITRIKVMAKLRIDERQSPQDGKIQFMFENQPVDIRVSIVPVKRGEKVVMRLLSERARQISLLSLGFAQRDLQKVREAYQKPYGMIIASGPTGAGKTTTMYAILKLLNNRDVNIMTIEDPIEYDIEGVNQMQVNAKAGLTFESGLRSILRQDPNIILVGEIRDKETADIAVNAAMTGHLVLSTLHTNDAATAIPRLFDMEIEAFLIASTLNVIVAQRLIRKIHGACRVSEDVPRETLTVELNPQLVDKVFGVQKSIRLYKGKGCSICHNTGYEERIGIFEVMLINDEIRAAITAKRDSTMIRAIAEKNGMRTMLEDGLDKVKQGETTIQEVLRVTKE